MGEMKNAYRIVLEKTERKTPIDSSEYRWKDNIKMDLKEIVYELDLPG
jgi:hypothetical protein